MPLAKTSFRSSGAQAQHAARSLDLKSQGSERNYQQALTGVAQFIKEERLGDLRGLSKETAERYLEMRSQEVGQKTLDLDRQAMQAVLGEKLAVVKSEQKQALESRASRPRWWPVPSQKNTVWQRRLQRMPVFGRMNCCLSDQ